MATSVPIMQEMQQTHFVKKCECLGLCCWQRQYFPNRDPCALYNDVDPIGRSGSVKRLQVGMPGASIPLPSNPADTYQIPGRRRTYLYCIPYIPVAWRTVNSFISLTAAGRINRSAQLTTQRVNSWSDGRKDKPYWEV